MRDRAASVKLIPVALIILLIFAGIQKCTAQINTDSLLQRVIELEASQKLAQKNVDDGANQLIASGCTMLGSIILSAVGAGILFIPNAPNAKYGSYGCFAVAGALTITSAGLLISSGKKMRSYTY